MDRFAFPDLRRAFRDGEQFGDHTVRVEDAGLLALPTGRVVACDPAYLARDSQPAYTRTVPPGRYPVLLSWLGDPRVSPNVACAGIRFSDAPVERWELALRPGWDVNTLTPGRSFGYGVDSGTGCFVDEWAVSRLAPDQERFKNAVNELFDRGAWSYETYLASMPVPVRQALQVRTGPAVVDPETGANIISFKSGIGDGCYASYFGLTSDGGVAWLVTDFGLLIRCIDGRLELSVPVRERSELTHPDLEHVGVPCVRVDWNPGTGEVTVETESTPYLQSLQLENRPGESLPYSVQGCAYRYRLAEPLQPTARVIVEYTLRTEAL